MVQDRVLATYLFETPHSLEHAAIVIAGEQSSGTFVAIPGETSELKERCGAQVVRIEPLDSTPSPSLPGSKPPRATGGGTEYRRGRHRRLVPAAQLRRFPAEPALDGRGQSPRTAGGFRAAA